MADSKFAYKKKKNTESSNSKPSIPHTLSTKLNNKGVHLIERRELFIPGFMKINNECNLRCIAHSILITLIPSLNQSDISGVRFDRSKSLHTRDRDPLNDFPSFIITLANSDLVKLVISAKKSYYYFTTKDLNPLFLNSEAAKRNT